MNEFISAFLVNAMAVLESIRCGGRSSARLERLAVAQEVAGSNPVGHPKLDSWHGGLLARYGTRPAVPNGLLDG